MVRKAFLTPPDIPEGLTCRTLKMPNSKEWLGIFNSALLNTIQSWQWEQVNDTDLTVEEAVAKCQEILDLFWEASECDVCLQPGGMPFIGFDDFGFFKQLGEEGWVAPYGDYAVPPIPPREDGTDEEKRCLAAANATNVLKILYEQLADDYAADRTTAEAISNLATAIALLIGAWLGLAIVAIIAIYRIMFQVVYETIEFVTADYWTTDFDAKLQCALYDCASVDGEGVVTFDLDCVLKGIAESTSLLDNPAFVLLFGQVQAMLSIIGADGLNAAGGTTAITSAECECGWRYAWDFTTSDGDFVYDPDQSPYNIGTWVDGSGWRIENTGVTDGCGLNYACGLMSQTFTMPAGCVITTMISIATNGNPCSHVEGYVGATRAAGLASGRLKIYAIAGDVVTNGTGSPISAESGVHAGIETNHNSPGAFYIGFQLHGTGEPPDLVGGAFF